MPIRINREWWVEERSAEWHATDVQRRAITSCFRTVPRVIQIGLIDNHCNSSLVNLCALNTYWLPEGRGRDLDIGEPPLGSLQITSSAGAPRIGKLVTSAQGTNIQLTGQAGNVATGNGSGGATSNINLTGQVGSVTT